MEVIFDFVMNILNFLGEDGLIILKYFVRTVIISGFGLGNVYVFGRLLGIVESDRIKNIIAVVAIFSGSILITLVYYSELSLIRQIWETSVCATIASVFYVVVGWKLYSRMDSFLDRRFGEDKKEVTRRGKRK